MRLLCFLARTNCRKAEFCAEYGLVPEKKCIEGYGIGTL